MKYNLIDCKNDVRLKVNSDNDIPVLVIEVENDKNYYIQYIDDSKRTDLSRFILTEEVFGDEIKCSNFISTLSEELERDNIGYNDFYKEHMVKLKWLLRDIGLSHNTINIYEDVLDDFLVEILESIR